MFQNFLSEPLWKRLGFPEPPDETTSGKGIGIVMLEEVINHPAIRHLKGRLKQITVNKDFSITCKDVILDEPAAEAPYPGRAEHGMMALQLLSHLPFEIDNEKYVGLVPAATFILLTNSTPEYIKVGLEWILERRNEWNIRVVCSTFTPKGKGMIKNTKEEPYVKALMPTVEAGVLVVSANGNSPAINDYQPKEFLAVGGYDDGGFSDLTMHKAHPAPSWGINGDGDVRPDILTPFTYLPAPYYETRRPEAYSPFYDPSRSDIKVGYFGGTSGSSTLAAGVCAHILSKYPHLKNEELKNALLHCGIPLKDTLNPAPTVHVGQTLKALSKGQTAPQYLSCPEVTNMKGPLEALLSIIEMQRGKALTELIDKGECSREMLWQYACDESIRVKKVAIWELEKPIDVEEKKKAWEYFHKTKNDGTGVREAWIYMLLEGAAKEDLDQWMSLITENNNDVRLCIRIYLCRYYPEAPEMEHTPDLRPEILSRTTEPVRQWYEAYKKMR